MKYSVTYINCCSICNLRNIRRIALQRGQRVLEGVEASPEERRVYRCSHGGSALRERCFKIGWPFGRANVQMGPIPSGRLS